jgi:hypothetical protein
MPFYDAICIRDWQREIPSGSRFRQDWLHELESAVYGKHPGRVVCESW